MTRNNFGVFAPALVAFAFLAYACAQGEVVQGDINAAGAAGSSNPGSAGTSPVGTGGTTGTGNVVGTGGSTPPGRGGNTGSAGSGGGRGGSAGTTVGRGGNTGTGGAGNVVGTGGAGNVVGTGGTTGGGGTTGAGGTSASACGSPTWAVSADGFVQMPVSQNGCWSGYPSTYADTYGSMVMPTNFMGCGMPCMLRMTGTLVAVSGTMYSYAGLGFNLGQTPAGGPTNTPVTPRGSGLTINFTNGTTGTGVVLRAQVTDGPQTWCTTVTTSPASIPYASFKKACYDATPGAAYNKEPITQIQLNLAGGTTAGTINLAFTSVTEMP